MNYIISLKEPIEKQKYLKSQGIETIWIKGINGKIVGNKYIKNHISHFYSEYGPRGSIGCALSHLKTILLTLKFFQGYFPHSLNY